MKRNAAVVLVIMITLGMPLYLINANCVEWVPDRVLSNQSDHTYRSALSAEEDPPEQENTLYLAMHYAGDILSPAAETEYLAAHYAGDVLTEAEESRYLAVRDTDDASPARRGLYP